MPIQKDGSWVLPDNAFGSGNLGLKTVRGSRQPMLLTKDIKQLVGSDFYNVAFVRGMAMDLEQAAVETSGAAETALKSLKEAVDKFRSTIANDLASIKSAGSRVQSEAQQMKQQYLEAQRVLTTDEFEKAISNAERMAAALKTLQDISATRISLAILDGRAD